MNSVKKFSAVVSAIVLLAMASSCSNSGTEAAPPSTPSTAATTPPPTPTTTSAPSPSTTATTPPVIFDPLPEDPSSDASAGDVLSAPAEGQVIDLSLANAFNPSEYWVEDRYDIASTTEVRGIAYTDFSCYDERELEFRLANNFSEITFSFGQANDSLDANVELKVAVYGDGKQLEINSVPFNKTGGITVNVQSVNSFKLNLSGEVVDSSCHGQRITPVIFDIKAK